MKEKAPVFIQEYEQTNGWTRWVQPIRAGYKMACCDCGLVHTMDFRVKDGRAQFRAQRDVSGTKLVRQRKRIRLSRSVK